MKNPKSTVPDRKAISFARTQHSNHVSLLIGLADEGQILVLEQYVENSFTTNHHTKFEHASLKHLEVIKS